MTSRLLALSLAIAGLCFGCGGPEDDLARMSSATSAAASLRDVDLERLEHRVPIHDGVELHVIEIYADDEPSRHSRRALLMLTGTFVPNLQYDADPAPGDDDEDFNALRRAARAGFYAFAVSYEGHGESTYPADGRDVTIERLIADTATLVEWIREYRHVWRVDLLGTSVGSTIAMALGSRAGPLPLGHVGRLVLTSVVYKDVTPLMREMMFSPVLRAMLEAAPAGYLQTFPPMYDVVLTHAEPAVATWAHQTFPGLYAVGPTLAGFDLPVFPVDRAHRPALQIWGDEDPVTPRSDVDQLQHEYGGPIDLVVLSGGGHSPIYEPVRDEMWQRVFEFLQGPSRCHGGAGRQHRCEAD